jgi:membrane protease YdiL (CAAX protease family)
LKRFPIINNQDPQKENTSPAVPWSVRDTWLGLLLFVLVLAVAVVITALLPQNGPARSISTAILEGVLVIPVAIILGWKRISWRTLGFRKFGWEAMALAVGLLVLVYPLIILHNMLLVWLGVETQGDSITQLYQSLGAPIPFLIAGVVLAPLAEEIFFRGFLYTGLRQRYGWVKSMLISSALFAGFHLQPVALIPTFMLGCVLAFAYQRSNSIWPGIILHFTINGLSLCATVLIVQLGLKT